MDAKALGAARDGRRRGASSAGNRVTLLSGARATYDALTAAISAAEERAWLSIYAFRPDRSGRPILAALEEAAARGVDVRLVVDAFGSRGLAPALEPLRARGASALAHRLVRRTDRRWHRPDARNHKKVAVFDSRVAFVGGVNVGDQFLDWRDLHLRVEGPGAVDLEAIVAGDHDEASGARLGRPGGGRGGAELAPARDGSVGPPDTPASDRPPDRQGADRLDVVTSSTPGAMHDAVLDVLASATERIALTTPYFVPDRAMRGALEAAARRGVRVDVLTPRRSNWPMANWAGRTFFPGLLAAGVSVAEHHDAMLHAKAIVVNGRVAAIGSPNFDARSFHINGEVLCLVHDPEVIAGIERAIEEDRRGARPVSPGDFGKRSRWDRAVEASAAIFAPWL